MDSMTEGGVRLQTHVRTPLLLEGPPQSGSAGHTSRPYRANDTLRGTNPSRPAPLLVQETLQAFGAGRMAKLGQGLGFQLPDPFSRHLEMATHLF